MQKQIVSDRKECTGLTEKRIDDLWKVYGESVQKTLLGGHATFGVDGGKTLGVKSTDSGVITENELQQIALIARQKSKRESSKNQNIQRNNNKSKNNADGSDSDEGKDNGDDMIGGPLLHDLDDDEDNDNRDIDRKTTGGSTIVRKNPNVKTDFLPDRERDDAERRLRMELQEKFQKDQARKKLESLPVVYSYWNGTGHRRKIIVKRGDTIGQFLRAVQEQLAMEFRSMKTAHVSNMMYIKEDMILPHDVTFHELMENKVRGKSGPLFAFHVSDEGSRQPNQGLGQQEEAHAGKVVESHWYGKNKHIFPAKNWIAFDKEKYLPSHSKKM